MNKIKWVQVYSQNESPLPRSCHELSYINNKLYVFGGENIARVPINSQMNVFDFETCKWNSVQTQNQPPLRLAHSQANSGPNIYIFGGRQGIGMDESSMNDLWVYYTEQDIWEQVECMGEIPESRSFHKMICVENYLYVFGGCGVQNRLNDLYQFDIMTKNWQKLPIFEPIKGRGGCSIGSNGQNIVITTGYTGDKENNDVYLYNIQTKEWKEIISNKQFRPRSVAAHCALGDLFVIFGGEVSTSDLGHEGAGDFESDIVLIDINSGDLKESILIGEDKPHARGWTSMQTIGQNKAVLFGGLTGNDENPLRLNDIWMLTLINE